MSGMVTSPEEKISNGGFLKKLEIMGNKLPNPAILFLILIAILAVISAILSSLNVTAVHPMTHKPILIKSLLSQEGLHWILTEMIRNYINFPPLGMIMVLTLGIGLAEKVGMMDVAIKASIHSIPKKYVTFAIVFISFMSHLASDAAIVVVPPIAAMLFYSLGRHPFAGFAASLAAIYSGFTANLLIVTTDVLLSGITTQAAKIVDPNAVVTPIDNWYFMSFSVFYLSVLTTIITEKFVEPRLGVYKGIKEVTLEKPSLQQINALRTTGIAALIFIVILLVMLVPEGAILRNPETGAIAGSPFMKGIVPLLFLFLLTLGLTYGIKSGSIRNADNVISMMSESFKGLSGFLVMAFAIAQFIAAFGWTNIATLVATSGAEFLQSINMTGLPALLCFMLFGQFLGLFTASGSAVWALLSPVFVPMFMLLGYHPAFIQMAFRAGDGSLNTIGIVNPFLPLFLEGLGKYKSDTGIGTYLSLMVPYAISFLIMWYLLFIFWYLTGWPVGPGAPQRLW
ncbi:AbgT family transporter [Pelosinus sp. IPA-1]|uniref:AbgT family transporter n=1 Tax=Pelosinus sp. IPA-1 TaxID=3029569 RepID=UPI0024361D9F|nr:AbgT family transporter [Pelosinus sp. IPA-1]GMA98016.1 p-aminobenzoyl-glutamate transporter [Pelosinus sp. IPA-1]